MNRKQLERWSGIAILMFLCVSSTGCVGTLAQLMFVVKGHDIPAEYSEFEGQRVAIVVGTDSSAYGQDPLANKIQRYVGHHLAANVDDIELVPSMEIVNWIDVNGWGDSPSQLAELGKEVSADLVLGINVEGYSIREGRTLYKGRSDVTLQVVDAESGNVTYSKGPEHFEYPENGRPSIQTTDRKFETFYLAWLTKNISHQFYNHDRLVDVADDAAFVE